MYIYSQYIKYTLLPSVPVQRVDLSLQIAGISINNNTSKAKHNKADMRERVKGSKTYKNE